MHTHQGQASAAPSQVGNWIARTDLLLAWEPESVISSALPQRAAF